MSEIMTPSPPTNNHPTSVYYQPHRFRTRAILSQHPEIRLLIGGNPTTFFYIVGLVTLQLILSAVVKNLPWWAVIAAAPVGIVPALGLYFLMHECTHHLVFRRQATNYFSG